MAADPEWVVVGHLSKPHGTKGEIVVWSLTDRPESTFLPDQELRVADLEGEAPDPTVAPLHIEAARPYRKGYLVRFDGVDDRDGADHLRGRYLLRPFEATEPLEEGELFYHQLLGLRVVTVDGVDVGTVTEVYALRPAHLLEVAGHGRDHLIPFTKDVAVEWSVEEGRMVIDPPEGLLDL